MVKRIAYIVILLMCATGLSFAVTVKSARYEHTFLVSKSIPILQDSLSKKLKQQQEEEKKKIKEISKARRQAKPEKIDENGNEVVVPIKPKSQRRPVGVERPPEIPRRNND
jgi:hypothetical protein